MGKGPKWSEEGVRALLDLTKGRLESVDEMSSERLDEHCKSKYGLEGYVGKDPAMKRAAIKEWFWQHALDGGVRPVVPSKVEQKAEAVNLDEQLNKVIEMLKAHGSATDGGIRNMVFKGNEKLCSSVLDYGLKYGKLKRDKLVGGVEVIVNA